MIMKGSSMDFNSIVGHEQSIENLRKAIKNGTISHSYIFEGEEGLGKMTVAKIFAKTLLCIEDLDKPCNSCISCKKFEEGNHPDFFTIEPVKNLIKVEEVEKIVSNIQKSPFESSKKVFIINDSHLMNVTAQNKFLKTMEEPPHYANFILITHVINRLLPTIISRGQRVKFFPLPYEDLEEMLVTDHYADKERAEFIAKFSMGNVGRSIELLNNEEFFKMREETIGIIDKILKGDDLKAFSSFEFFENNKENIDIILDMILLYFRDLMIYKKARNDDLIYNKDMLDIISTETFVDFCKINDIIEKVQQTKENVHNNVNYQLSIENMLLNMGGI